jgi:hypothetical protein
MLRANMDEIIKNSPYSEPVGGFLFGFSSTFIAFLSLVICIFILYDYYRFDKNSIVTKVKHAIFDDAEFVLPLYIKNNGIKMNENLSEIEVTEKPDLTAFVIPAINTEQIGFPMSPLSSGLKRRTISMNSFGTGANAPTPTISNIQTPFHYEIPEKAHSV